jgi:hypothetical protein
MLLAPRVKSRACPDLHQTDQAATFARPEMPPRKTLAQWNTSFRRQLHQSSQVEFIDQLPHRYVIPVGLVQSAEAWDDPQNRYATG